MSWATPSIRIRVALVAGLLAVAALITGLCAGHPQPAPASPPYADPASEAELRALVRDPTELAAGKRLFMQNCTLCHGLRGQGINGPNLRDDFWIGGSDMHDILARIADGRPERGMAAWKQALDRDQLRALAAYVASLSGSPDTSGRAPEGTRRPITWK